jgi:hypothetical protein
MLPVLGILDIGYSTHMWFPHQDPDVHSPFWDINLTKRLFNTVAGGKVKVRDTF